MAASKLVAGTDPRHNLAGRRGRLGSMLSRMVGQIRRDNRLVEEEIVLARSSRGIVGADFVRDLQHGSGAFNSSTSGRQHDAGEIPIGCLLHAASSINLSSFACTARAHDCQCGI